MDKGGSKSSWRKSGQELTCEVAAAIDSKPDESWLVIYHQDALGGSFIRTIRPMIANSPDRVKFLHWGAHKGTNAFADIWNIILAGTLFYPESYNRALAYASTGWSLEQPISDDLVKQVAIGEALDLILQGLCRAAGRGCRVASVLPATLPDRS